MEPAAPAREPNGDWDMTPDFAWPQELFRGALLGVVVVFILLLFLRFHPTYEVVDDDAFASWQPIFTDFARQLREGHIPVWSHHTSCGFPLLGWPQPSFVCPTMWLAHGVCTLFGLEQREFAVLTLLHYCLAAGASFVYLRRFGVHPLAAVTASLGFSLSGALMGLGRCWPNYVIVVSFWPLLFLCIEELRVNRAIFSRSWLFWTILLGWLGGMGFLINDLLSMTKLSFMAALYFLGRVRRETLLGNLLALGVASLVALAVGAGQLAPSLEIILSSPRLGGGGVDVLTTPAHLWVGFIYPFWYLDWEQGAWRASGGLFVGPCAVLGLLFCARSILRRRGPQGTLFVLAVLYLTLALGHRFPPSVWLHSLPPFSSFRWPFRWQFEACSAIALLTGFGMDLAYRAVQEGRGHRLIVAFAVLSGLVLALRHEDAPGMMLPRFVMLLVWAAGLTGMLFAAQRVQAERFLRIALAWTALAMIVNIPVAQTTTMAALYRLLDNPLPVGRDTQERVLFLARIFDVVWSAQKEGNLWRSLPHALETRVVTGYVYRPSTQGWMTGFDFDGSVKQGMEPEVVHRFLAPPSTLLTTLRVGHVVVFKNNKILAAACAAHPHLQFESETEFYRIYKHTGFKEPAYFVRELKAEQDPDDIIDLGLRVHLPEQALVAQPYNGPKSFSGEGSITQFREHHGKISFDVATQGEQFVVVTTTYFPRWRATVDGTSTPLVRVNGSFLGLRVPAGSHHVQLDYWPVDHLVIWAFSIVAWLVTALAAVWLMVNRRSSSPPVAPSGSAGGPAAPA